MHFSISKYKDNHKIFLFLKLMPLPYAQRSALNIQNSTKGKIFFLHAVFSEMRSGISQSLAGKLSDSLLYHEASRISPWVPVKLFKCFGKIYLLYPKKGNIEKMSSQLERIRVLLGLKQSVLQFPSQYYLLIRAMSFTSTEVLYRITNSTVKTQM